MKTNTPAFDEGSPAIPEDAPFLEGAQLLDENFDGDLDDLVIDMMLLNMLGFKTVLIIG